MVSLKLKEEKSSVRSPISITAIHVGMMQLGAPLMLCDVIAIAEEALRYGFVSTVLETNGMPAYCYNSTEDYYDLQLAIAGSVSFGNLLLVAGQDARFADLFKEINAGRY
jgi:hypothetical protein